MSPAERRLARRTALLGFILTLLVIAIDAAGLLRPLDNWLYDRRARLCQFFSPPPSDDLIYIDIDDQSLDSIGEFPWPRDTLASIVDEIHRAGARTIAFDIIFDKPQPKADAALADACKKFNHALLPVSFDLDSAGIVNTPRTMVLSILKEDLELSPQQVIKAIRDRGNAPADLESRVQQESPEALRDAMYDRIAEKVGADEIPDPLKLRPVLLPRTSPAITDSYLLKQLVAQCERVKAERSFRRFARKPQSSDPPLLQARRVMPPVSTLGNTATFTGYVDYVVSDGVVRTLPLFIKYKDGLYPQAGLSLACAILDLDPANPAHVQLTDSAVTLRPANKEPIHIPVRQVSSYETRRWGGAFIDVPWYGERDWADMYARFNKKPHLLINDIWQLSQSRRALATNIATVDQAIKPLLEALRPDQLKSKPPPPDDHASRLKLIDSLLMEMKPMGYLETYQGKSPDSFDKDEDKVMARAVNAVTEFQTRTPVLLDMISRQETFLRSRLQNRAALIGYVATAVAASDFVPTSLYPRCPGVIVHGAIANGILTGELWRTAPRWVGILVTLLVGLVSTAAIALLSPWKALIATLTLVIAYLAVNGILLFDYLNILIDPSAGGVLAVAFLTFLGCTITRLLIEGAERARITRRFRAYQDPGFANFIIEHPEQEQKLLKETSRELTICFTDLAGFTSLSEKLGPGIVNLIRQYLTEMVPVIHRRHGHVDKFSGDGIMFFFGAPLPNPNHAADTVATVLDMQLALATYNERLAEQNLPQVNMRAGIATGHVIAGDIGSADRSNYTVLGDDVNLASRLESANKITGTNNLLTQVTADAIKDQFLLRPVGKLQVIGRSTAVMTYEALCALSQATEAQRQLVAVTTEMVIAFQEARFDDCQRAASELESHSPSKLAAFYRTLCTLQTEPFDGRIILAEK